MASLVLVEMILTGPSGSMIWLMLKVTRIIKPLALLSEPSVLWLEILVLVGSLARWRILLDI